MGILAFNRAPLAFFVTSLVAVTSSCTPEEQLEFDEFCDSRGLYLCNTTEPACYQPLAEFVACLREKPLLTVPSIEVLSAAEWRAEVTEYAESESAQNFEHLVTGIEFFDRFPSTRPTRQERIDAQSAQLLIERSASLIQLVDHGEGFASERQHLKLASALASSMLQQEYDYEALAERAEGDPVHQTAIASVLYATGLLASNMVYSALQNESFWTSPWLSSFQTRERELDESLRSGEFGLERFLYREAPVPELYSQRLVHQSWRESQSRAIEELLESLPTSIDEIGDRSGVRSASPWSPNSGEHRVFQGEPLLLGNDFAGFQLAQEFVMGSWLASYFLYRTVPESEDAYNPQALWMADTLWVFHRSSSNTTAALWLWAPGSDLNAYDWQERFDTYLRETEKPWRVVRGRVSGEEVLGLVACDDPELLDAWEAELLRTIEAVSLRPSNAASGP